MPFPSSPTNGQLANINNISYTYNSTSGTWSKTSLGTANVSLLTSNGGTITGPITFSAGSLTFSPGSVSSPGINFTGSTSSGMYAPGSNGLGISTNGANAIVIDSSQRVGLNTDTPTQRLTIAGSLSNNIYQNITNGTQNFIAGISSTNLVSLGTTSNDGLAIFTNNTERARFDAGGNLAVGVSTTSNKLQVTNATAADTFARLNNSVAQVDTGVFANALVYSGYANSDVVTGTSGAGTYRVFTSGAERVRVNANGNVGFNQTNPAALVHIGTGSTTRPQLEFDASSLTSVVNAGAVEYDGNVFYATPDTLSGRAVATTKQIQYMTGDYGPIGSGMTNAYGATSALNLQADHAYLIEGQITFTKNTAGGVTFAIINNQTPQNVNIFVAGIDTAGTAYGRALNNSTATNAAVNFSSITDTRTVIFDFRSTVETSLTSNSWVKIQMACTAGTVTIRRGSWWSVTKLQGVAGTTGNTGAFLAGA